MLLTLRGKGEQQSWEAIKNSQTSSAIEEFLKIYPNSEFAAEARQRLAEARTKTCPRPLVGASVSAPDNLQSANGKLKVDFSLRTSVGLFGLSAIATWIQRPAGAHASAAPGR